MTKEKITKINTTNTNYFRESKYIYIRLAESQLSRIRIYIEQPWYVSYTYKHIIGKLKFNSSHEELKRIFKWKDNCIKHFTFVSYPNMFE